MRKETEEKIERVKDAINNGQTLEAALKQEKLGLSTWYAKKNKAKKVKPSFEFPIGLNEQKYFTLDEVRAIIRWSQCQ